MKSNSKSSKSQYKEGEGSFSPSFKTIENNLKETIVSVEDLDKLYGSKSNNSVVTTIGNKGCLKRYVLKCASLQDVTNEVTGTKALEKFLPVTKIVAHSLKDRKAWLLREYVSGILMADITNHFEPLEGVGCLQELEIKKESLIIKGYAKSTKKLNLDEYLGLASNKLFYQRLVGERYKKFYVEGKFLPQFMNKKILINGRGSPMTLKKIFESILKKYSLIKQVCVFPGHGDAHQGNVIVSDKGDIVFIDNEYSGMMPAYMDLSKPYYNDLLGTLFFYFHERLLSYFEVESVKNDKTTLSLNIRLKQKLDTRMKITQIKLNQRSKYLNDKEDFLTLNDYLFMCHTLNRDPNQFPEVVRWLFLAFCRVLYEFDSLDPESIYSYFEN